MATTRPLLASLAGDAEIETLLSDAAQIAHILDFERALAEAEADAELITADAAAAIVSAIAGFSPDWDDLAVGMARDGVVVPALVRQLRAAIGEKHGKALHIKRSHLEWADRWFERYGSYAVFFSRMLPIIRTFISLPAGVARMPFWKFSVLTFLGALPWVFLLTFIGKQVGSNWENWKDSLHYVDYAVAAIIVVGVVYLFVRWWRGRRTRAAATDVA